LIEPFEGTVLDQQQGFVLIRHWRDTPQGTHVEFWLATDDGPQLVQLPYQTSVAFFPADRHEQVASLLRGERDVELRALDLKDFQHRPVMGLYCWQHHQLLRAGRLLRRAGIPVFEADIRPPERYLMERFITAPVRFSGTPDTGGLIRQARMRPAPAYRPRLRLASLDVETNRHGELYSIAVEGCDERQVWVLGPLSGNREAVDFRLDVVGSRAQLLQALCDWLAQHDPDAIIGWNLVQFDLRTLHEHSQRLQVPLRLARGGALME
jgi:DNA polymerase-2